MTMSDRIAVMRAGRIEQLGTPEDLYERPATDFVADSSGRRTCSTGEVTVGATGCRPSGFPTGRRSGRRRRR